MERDMKIRAYQDGDQVSVIELWHECNLVVPWNDPERDIDVKLKTQPEMFLVGVLDGRIVASAMAGYDGHRGWVYYLGVSPEHRNKGYGRHIMEEASAMLKEVGCLKVNVCVRNSNNGVREFYGSLGYKDDDVIVMGKRLVD